MSLVLSFPIWNERLGCSSLLRIHLWQSGIQNTSYCFPLYCGLPATCQYEFGGLTTLNQGHSVLGLQRHKCQCIRRSWLRHPALAPAWQFTSLQPAGSLPSWHSFLVCRMRVTVSVSLMLGMCCDSAVFPPCCAGWCGERAVRGFETGCRSAEVFTLVPGQQPPDSSSF